MDWIIFRAGVLEYVFKTGRANALGDPLAPNSPDSRQRHDIDDARPWPADTSASVSHPQGSQILFS